MKITFVQAPDKTQAWQNLHRLTQDKQRNVRQEAAAALGSAFSRIPDKIQAWDDLISLTQDKDWNVRQKAIGSLKTASNQAPDKTQVWPVLHALIQDTDRNVRREAADILGIAIGQVPDRTQAWDDLISLTHDKDWSVRQEAAAALGSAFSRIPDKDKDRAWQDLISLTQDKDWNVRWNSAIALGKGFRQVPNRARAWNDLLELTHEESSDVRMFAYHSLGRASVSKATEATDRDTLKRELEAAVAYFEKSSHEQSIFNPAEFCYPFYRSYFAITFKEAKEEEIEKYLAEAREAVGGSASKNELLNAVENLAGALQESLRLKDRSVQELASDLNAYMWFCEKAAEHMAAAEDKAPEAIKLMRKCNPFIEGRIQYTISEIQEKAGRSVKLLMDLAQRSRLMVRRSTELPTHFLSKIFTGHKVASQELRFN